MQLVVMIKHHVIIKSLSYYIGKRTHFLYQYLSIADNRYADLNIKVDIYLKFTRKIYHRPY